MVKDFFAEYPTRAFRRGHVLVQAEEDPSGIFYLEEGRVIQYDISSSGGTIVVNAFKPQAFFPMSWAMNKGRNHYFFEASTATVVRVAPPEDVVRFLHKNPEVTFDLLSRVYRGADGLLRRMAHLMGGDARSRLLFEIVNATYRFGEQQADGSFSVALTESELANYSGLARETISRLLQQFKAAGLVDVNHHGFVVRDLKRLQSDLGNDL